MRTTVKADRWDDTTRRHFKEFASLTLGDLMKPPAPSGPNGSALPKFTVGDVVTFKEASNA